MPTAAGERAKARLQAILDDPMRKDTSGMKNRMAATRYPSSGSEMTNLVDRRPSQSSQNSETRRFRGFFRDMLSRPAY